MCRRDVGESESLMESIQDSLLKDVHKGRHNRTVHANSTVLPAVH